MGFRFDLNQSANDLAHPEFPAGLAVEPLQMEFGNMMFFGMAGVAMTVFLVTLFTVAWITENRKQ